MKYYVALQHRTPNNILMEKIMVFKLKNNLWTVMLFTL